MNILDHLEIHRKSLMIYATRLTHNKEIAQDLLQTVALKFLQNPIKEEIINAKSYLFIAVKQAYLNYRTVNKKYVYLQKEVVDSEYEKDIIDSIALSRIRDHVKDLPPKQAQAISRALNGQTVGEHLGSNVRNLPQYETAKSNHRLATQNLKNILKE